MRKNIVTNNKTVLFLLIVFLLSLTFKFAYTYMSNNLIAGGGAPDTVTYIDCSDLFYNHSLSACYCVHDSRSRVTEVSTVKVECLLLACAR